MDHPNTIWIKQEETDCVPDEPGLMSYRSEAMDHPNTIWIKQEETDCVPDEPGSTSYRNEAMDHSNTIWIKQEKTDCVPDEPGLMFLEDPLETEVSGLPVNPDPEEKLCVDSSDNNVEAAARCSSNSARVIQNSGKCYGSSFEETVMQGPVPNELEIGSEESTRLTMFDTHTQGLEAAAAAAAAGTAAAPEEEEEEEEDNDESLFVARLKCSWRENECHTFICNFCLQSFTSKYRLIMHVFIHMDGVQPPKSICKSCGEIFSRDIGLQMHLKLNVGDQASSSDHNDKRDCIYKDETMFLEGNEKLSAIEQMENQSSSQLKSQAFRATGSKSHRCDVCGKSFTRVGDFNRHALMHTGRKSHKCDVCGKSFSELYNLKTHALIHTGVKAHKCNVCGKSFTFLSDLRRHGFIHTGRRAHKCNICGKSFTTSGDLKRHTLIHTKTRPHKCDVCGKTFTLLSHLKRHVSLHTRT